MIYKLILRIIPSLIYSVIFLVIFYEQFLYIYNFIINKFSNMPFYILYKYVFLYTYGILILAITIVNLFSNFLIKDKIFLLITLISISIFYILSFEDMYHIIKFFIKFPTYTDGIIFTIFFVVLAFGYLIYSIILAILGRNISKLEIILLMMITIVYGAYVFL